MLMDPVVAVLFRYCETALWLHFSPVPLPLLAVKEVTLWQELPYQYCFPLISLEPNPSSSSDLLSARTQFSILLCVVRDCGVGAVWCISELGCSPILAKASLCVH
ncbi:uncharacterized protein WM294_005446 [Sarcoramphus papa]